MLSCKNRYNAKAWWTYLALPIYAWRAMRTDRVYAFEDGTGRERTLLWWITSKAFALYMFSKTRLSHSIPDSEDLARIYLTNIRGIHELRLLSEAINSGRVEVRFSMAVACSLTNSFIWPLLTEGGRWSELGMVLQNEHSKMRCIIPSQPYLC